jgi:hypothetical protein
MSVLGLCFCGREAIGICTRGGETPCVDHGWRINELLVCQACRDRHVAELQRAKDEELSREWEPFVAALAKARSRGFRVPPGRRTEHRYAPGRSDWTGEWPGESQAVLDRMHVGMDCPDHTVGACKVTQVDSAGVMKRRVTLVHFTMDLWQLGPGDWEATCVNRVGEILPYTHMITILGPQKPELLSNEARSSGISMPEHVRRLRVALEKITK